MVQSVEIFTGFAYQSKAQFNEIALYETCLRDLALIMLESL
ncbi:hypothetical protein [Methylomonas albis]|nr:hypothetical protein [Methylomonas albis]